MLQYVPCFSPSDKHFCLMYDNFDIHINKDQAKWELTPSLSLCGFSLVYTFSIILRLKREVFKKIKQNKGFQNIEKSLIRVCILKCLRYFSFNLPSKKMKPTLCLYSLSIRIWGSSNWLRFVKTEQSKTIFIPYPLHDPPLFRAAY